MSQKDQRKPRRRRIAGESVPRVQESSAEQRPAPPRPRPVARPARPLRRPVVDPKTQAAAPDSSAAAPAAADESTRLRRPANLPSWRVLVAVLALAAGVALSGWGLWELRGGGEQGLEAANRQASRAAGEAAETIFTFSHDALDEHEENAKALMTPDFQSEFDKVAPGLRDIAPQREFEVQAQVQDAGAVPCGDDCSLDRVQVLVFVDQVRLIAGAEEEPAVLGNRVVMTMERSQGTWLVDEIRAL
ncbi:hypothetical protein D9V41_05010 [Aeromicrobium phragmitis]|uniref:Mce-associated membrane protein n=1 Tax=Aeromicrobium phragmitis TaxID=2478914 RepID=A0A3L8PNS6_9ACTN|nr:hypothetical protein [Aeromicrobium phragmitis]RLV56439.1 hypothetical protein D9V41_05010 [Aeromicrobium phragmitis]